MRYYVRKTNRGKTPQKLMETAAYAVMHQGQSLRAVAKALNVGYATLFRFIKKLRSGDNPTVGYKPKLLFTASQEQEIVKQLAQYAKVFCGLSLDEVRKLSFQIARRWKYVIPESWVKNSTASKDWGDKFVIRHNFPVKPLKGKSMINFYTMLDKLMDKHKFLPSRIYYLEEITVPIAKYIPDTGLANLKPVCMELAVNASGEIVTPMLMMNNDEYKLNDKSNICIVSKTEISNATDSRYLNHFIDRTKPCVADPVLLIIDNCQYVDMNVLKKAKQNSIILLCIPKSEGSMKPLAKLAKFIKKPSKAQKPLFEPGCDISNIVCAMMPSKKEIVKCFSDNGVWPFNPSAVTGEVFVPEPVEEYNFKVSVPGAQPLPGPSRIPNTQTSDTDVSSNDLSRGTIDQCRFCGEFTKCVPVSNKPYISNITTLAFNDITVQLDFNDETLPKTVCQACDAKLREMHDFVKVVKAAQESMINVAQPRQVDVEIEPREDYETLIVKTEYDDDEGKDEDDGDNNESKDEIVDSLTIGETIYIKEAVTQKRKTKTASPKKTKKAKVTEVKSETEDAELIIDIKEEVIEIDTNDLESDTGCFVSDTGCSVSDTGTDAKPTEVELATSALVFEMRSDGSGYS
ncbi:uncharacterized protein LOC134752807 isoform X2 [Cydia strobilella]|uniref:uncharacterized protein LOC134752807 isoform X2 n=1 Tax=Cydia strobilella TaxID=1100964 RepID=UPI00300774DC